MFRIFRAARKGSSQCRRVVFIWAIRDASKHHELLSTAHSDKSPTISGHVQWISDALYRAGALTPTWLNVSIRIFATRGGIPFSENSVDPEQTPDKESSHDWMTPPSVRLENGRPDLKSILRGEVNTASGSMSVTGVSFYFPGWALTHMICSMWFAESGKDGAPRAEVPCFGTV